MYKLLTGTYVYECYQIIDDITYPSGPSWRTHCDCGDAIDLRLKNGHGNWYYCPPCLTRLQTLERERAKREHDERARRRIEHGPLGCDDEECSICCDHEPDPDEGYHCSNCGEDCSESAYANAEAYADSLEDR